MAHARGTGVPRAPRAVALVVALAVVIFGLSTRSADVSEAFPSPGSNTRISRPVAGFDRDAFGAAMSHNGRFVAFLAPRDAADAAFPRTLSLFVDDRSNAAPPQFVLRPNVLCAAIEGPPIAVQSSFEAVRVSDDGRHFALEVSRDPAADCEVTSNFVETFDVGAAAPEVVPAMEQCPPQPALSPLTTPDRLDGMSADGTQVLVHVNVDFTTAAPGCEQSIAVWNRPRNQVVDVIHGVSNPVAGLQPESQGAISADGAHIAFLAITNGNFATLALYAYDRDVENGGVGNGVFDQPNVVGHDHQLFQRIPAPGLVSLGLAISGNGRVIEVSAAPTVSNIAQITTIDRDPAGGAHTFPFETAAERVSEQVTNGNDASFPGQVSFDGRYVTFMSVATNLVPGTTFLSTRDCLDGESPQCRVYIADRFGTGGVPQIELASDGETNSPGGKPPNPDGNSSDESEQPPLADSGRVVAYESFARNLTGSLECDDPPCNTPNTQDFDDDVFVHVFAPGLIGAPDPVELGPALAGQSTPPQVVAFSHTGFGDVRATSVDIIGADAGEFVILPGETCTGSVIHVAEKCFVPVAFKPTRGGAATATLEVHHNGRPGVSTVQLVGGGVAVQANFVVQPALLDFGTKVLTVQSNAQAVVARNVGNVPLVFAPALLTGTAKNDFRIVTDTCSPGSLPPAASCTVTIVFKPRAVGARGAALLLSGGPTASPPTVALVGLQGNAPMPAVTVSPAVTRPGSVVGLQGRNWPPGAFVFLTWQGLPGLTDRVVTLVPGVVDPLLDQFAPSESQIVYPRATVGTRTLHAVAPTPDVDGGSAVAFPAGLLVQTPTVNPPTVGGDLALLLRNG